MDARFPLFQCAGLIVALVILGAGHAAASAKPVLASITTDPAILKEGDEKQASLKTIVKLQAPSPTYFICEVRSEDRKKLECTSIIFKKGDIEGQGNGTLRWSRIAADASLKLTACNIEAPDAGVSCAVTVKKKKDAESP